MSRIVMHIDMNAFFASVEQRCDPGLRGKPIAVVGSGERTVVTTASYEARKYGVKTGMNKYEAKRLCPRLIFVTGDSRKYIDTSLRVLEILKGFSSRVEPYSIDEAFLDITGMARPRDTAVAVKYRIMKELGLTCSIGIAPNKLLAKLASDMEKPDGLVMVRDEDVTALLKDLPAGELWGIGPRLTEKLGAFGIRTCGELGNFPASALRERFGIIGERLKLMGQGIDVNPVVPMGEEEEAKSIGHSTTLPRDIPGKGDLKKIFLRLSEMVGARAREHDLKGRKVSITLRYPDFYTFSRERTLSRPTNDTHHIFTHALEILEPIRLKSAVRLVGISISDLSKGNTQLHLFEMDRRRERLLGTMDYINKHFGDLTLTWATLLEDDPHPGVISPSWRPSGVKRINLK